MHNWIWKSQPCWGPSILTGRNALTSAADAFFWLFGSVPAYCTCSKVFRFCEKDKRPYVCTRKAKVQKALRQHTHTPATHTPNGKQKIRCASNGWLLNRNATHESNKHTQVSFALLFVGFGYMCALSVGNKYNDIKLGYISHSLPFECSGAVCARHMHIPATFRE